jgi:hypothetical protein
MFPSPDVMRSVTTVPGIGLQLDGLSSRDSLPIKRSLNPRAFLSLVSGKQRVTGVASIAGKTHLK